MMLQREILLANVQLDHVTDSDRAEFHANPLAIGLLPCPRLRKARAFITCVSLEPRKCRLPEATCTGSGIVLSCALTAIAAASCPPPLQ